ncbi:hypothetical protein BOC41_09600 [Burkholderia pseudomallei]|nr:hypothetical protein BOC44_06425 [Burkholderia pseudomallei]OSP96638.1 hypothetical protein BOC41_09600 [Burkholderia pseudomallei]
MPLREVLFGVSVATLVPTTLVGSTLATSFHIVETVLGTRLQATGTYAPCSYTVLARYSEPHQQNMTRNTPGRSR